MGVTAAIADDLKARVMRGTRGELLTFPFEDRWLTMTVRETPHLEMSMPAPDLVGLKLDAQFGPETVLATAGPAADPKWMVRSRDRGRAAALFDEEPWPAGLGRRKGTAGTVAAIGGLVAFFVMPVLMLPIGLGLAWAYRDQPTTGRYVLTVEDTVATIEQRSSEVNVDAAIGMARRLVQVVTWPARHAVLFVRPAPRPPRGGGDGPYR